MDEVVVEDNAVIIGATRLGGNYRASGYTKLAAGTYLRGEASLKTRQESLMQIDAMLGG